VVTHHERVVRGDVAFEHIVQLFDAPDSLGPSVAAFLARGLAQRSKLLMVARPQHSDAITRSLASAGYDPDALIADGTLTVLDARATLRRIVAGGQPDPALFATQVGVFVQRLADGSDGPLHIYGEIVDLLAEEGSFDSVNKLESMWNALAQGTSFSLFCGYGSGHFAAGGGDERLRAVCRHHTRVERGSDDLLGNWLLNGVVDATT
jgi:hypothetical protein